MAVTIRAAGILKQHVSPGATVENARTVGEAVDQLELPHTDELIMLVNGKPAYWGTELRDGDTLSLLPGIGGGCESRVDPGIFFRFPRVHISPP
jgi:molybdopterin converting factor small subunit